MWFTALSSIWPLEMETIAIHHGSLDPSMRHQVEEGLRQQCMRCVVATSSLDLGVDFPAVDLVIQVGPAHSVARTVQRAGRAKHRPGEPVHLTVVATQALDLCEFAATRELAQQNQFENRQPLRLCLDVLSQHAMSLSLAGGFESTTLYDEVRTTAAFATLDAAQWQSVLDFLVRGGQALDAYPQYRRLQIDANGRYVPVDAKVARRHRMAIGTITEQSMVKVQFLRGARLGSVEEAFISKLQPGDVFNFAGRCLELFRVEGLTAWVRKSSKPGTLTPAWTGGFLPFSDRVGQSMKLLMAQACHEPFTELSPELVFLQPLLALQAQRSHVPRSAELLIEIVPTSEGKKRRAKDAFAQEAWFI
ncbi:MAG: helicase-related protein, partial [Comamonas sp.]